MLSKPTAILDVSTPAMSACEVVRQIVASDKRIEVAWAVIYKEGPNWRDNTKLETTSRALKQAIRQDIRPRNLVQLSRSELLQSRLCELLRELAADQLLGIVSKVSMA